jgi:hypothetical protein
MVPVKSREPVSGDIVVSPFTGGCLIGRLRAQRHLADCWELLKVESDIDTAIAFAHEFALHGRGHAWVCEGFGKVRAI